MSHMTEREMLRFESIFDLLTELGFTEDQAHERMLAPGRAQAVAFAQIGGADRGRVCPLGDGERAPGALSDRIPPTAAGRAPFSVQAVSVPYPELEAVLRKPVLASVSHEIASLFLVKAPLSVGDCGLFFRDA